MLRGCELVVKILCVDLATLCGVGWVWWLWFDSELVFVAIAWFVCCDLSCCLVFG